MSPADRTSNPGAAPSRHPSRAWALALGAAAASATLCLAAVSPAALAGEAMREVRDPVTGELRGPTAAEVAAFQKAEAQLRAAAGKKPSPAPVEIRYADGTVETKLGDDTMMYSVVRATEDGSLTMACLPADEARAFVASARKSTPAPHSATSATVKAAAKAPHAHD